MKEFIPLASMMLQELFKNKSKKVDFQEIEIMISLGKENKIPFLTEMVFEKTFKSQTDIDLPFKEIKKLVKFKNMIGGTYGWKYYKEILHFLVPSRETIYSVKINKFQKYFAQGLLLTTVSFISIGFIFILLSDLLNFSENFNLLFGIFYSFTSISLLIFVRALESQYKAIEINKKVLAIVAERGL